MVDQIRADKGFQPEHVVRSMEEAIQLVAGSQDTLQRQMTAKVSLDNIAMELDKLRQMGFDFGIVNLVPKQTEEFPKMLYQGGPRDLKAMIVPDAKAEKEALASGWRNNPEVPPPAPASKKG